MQSFYRRNSLHNQSTSQKSPNKIKKETRFKKIKENGNKYGEGDVDEDDNNVISSTRENYNGEKSFNTNHHYHHHDPSGEFVNDDKKTSLPIIKIESYDNRNNVKIIINDNKNGGRSKQHDEITDNSIRLGPNKNNIIEEELKREKKNF
ncbi:hypothetical protein Phum_PHUM529530 [Pediculus humanus corporis]|uniref:Uncharacterized protein n=1 Tax=Pediculus humanus subsp. corporis TaxID=121224 RepID=E0VZB2_PEDHC|nr:uncharacterized protein Phum_PHUM529530 [Pediculus humanus corporis]EEB18718.1 hypothetical protein Phum_PHUM529530 [Pediculus humanus corporis]